MVKDASGKTVDPAVGARPGSRWFVQAVAPAHGASVAPPVLAGEGTSAPTPALGDPLSLPRFHNPFPLLPILKNAKVLPRLILGEVDIDVHSAVFALQMPGGMNLIVVSDPDIAQEILTRADVFEKIIPRSPKALSPLALLRNWTMAGSGLFTSSTADPEWGIAHRVLLPSFGARNIKTFFPQIREYVWKLMDVLSGPLDKPVDFYLTCLTLDTIAKCAFDISYNALGSDAPNQFVKDMFTLLTWAQVSFPPRALARRSCGAADSPLLALAVRPCKTVRVSAQGNLRKLPPSPAGCASVLAGDERRRREANNRIDALMRSYITDRRALIAKGGDLPSDILQTMVTARDKVTGVPMSDEVIVNNLFTFLVAGHETTCVDPFP